MKKILVLAILCISFSVNAQQKEKKFVIDSSSVLTLHKTIKTLYKVISAEKQEDRNWKQFKYLFKPGAKLIPSGEDSEGVHQARYMSPNEYIEGSSKWLKTNGFIEKEISRKVNSFGNIAQVFSTYECYYSKTDKTPFMRGINSIQLLNDGTRWWIVNLFWSQETEDSPIPKAYLPK